MKKTLTLAALPMLLALTLTSCSQAIPAPAPAPVSNEVSEDTKALIGPEAPTQKDESKQKGSPEITEKSDDVKVKESNPEKPEKTDKGTSAAGEATGETVKEQVKTEKTTEKSEKSKLTAPTKDSDKKKVNTEKKEQVKKDRGTVDKGEKTSKPKTGATEKKLLLPKERIKRPVIDASTKQLVTKWKSLSEKLYKGENLTDAEKKELSILMKQVIKKFENNARPGNKTTPAPPSILPVEPKQAQK